MQQRLLSDGQSSRAYTPDPALEQNQALRALHQRVTEEAQVRAYNDVISLNQLFAVLLLGRARFGWRGRNAVRVLYAGAMLLLLAYVGSRFVLEVVLGRTT